ncbi:MAG: hypothetical protein IMZ55_18295 [Acidobacteria bacterium]|nr:hypothetical protein [Acidobacteriota bacterium]
MAEVWLLIRDALLFEDGNRLVLLGGVPAEWLGGRETVAVERMPTHFGPCSFTYAPADGGAAMVLAETAAPAEGFILRLPASLGARVTADGKPAKAAPNGDVPLPLGTKHVEIRLPERATEGNR